MHCLTIALAAAALVAPSFALPQASPVVPATYWWNVTRSQSGCSGGSCTYDFQVAAPADGGRPHFKAHCSGKGTGRFKTCELLEGETNVGPPEVLAKLQREANPNRPDGIGRIGVRLVYSNLADDGFTYTYTFTGNRDILYNLGSTQDKRYRVIPTKATAIG